MGHAELSPAVVPSPRVLAGTIWKPLDGRRKMSPEGTAGAGSPGLWGQPCREPRGSLLGAGRRQHRAGEALRAPAATDVLFAPQHFEKVSFQGLTLFMMPVLPRELQRTLLSVTQRSSGRKGKAQEKTGPCREAASAFCLQSRSTAGPAVSRGAPPWPRRH